MTGIHLTTQPTAGWIWAHILFLYAFPAIALMLSIAAWFYLGMDELRLWKRLVASVVTALPVAAISVGIFIWVNWPLQTQYHEYVPTTITVAQIGSRFVSADQGSNQRYVFLDTDGIPYAVDDTRASLVKVGQVVTLMCVREWQQNGVPGYACNWGEIGPNGK